jgi:beta-glucanase (GH16 family)
MLIVRCRPGRRGLMVGAALVLAVTAALVGVLGTGGPARHAGAPAPRMLANAGPGRALPSGAAAPNGAAVPSGGAVAGGLVWADDFNGPAGSPPDASKWNHETGGGGFGNSELEYYTDSTSNAALDGNGDLVITARAENPAGYGCWYGPCRYTSARLNTNGKFAARYGHVEARIKLPRGRGMWPAFWATGSDMGTVGWPDSGEMDIMETIGSTPNLNHGSLHGPGYSGGSSLTGTYPLPNGQSFADGFHTFAIDWAPDRVSFLVDGVTYETHTAAETDGKPWAFNHPFNLLLNVAVGGVWPGPPDASTSFPQQLVVDYVHVYAPQTGDGGGDGAGGGTGGGGGTGVAGTITGAGGRCVDASGGVGAAIRLSTCDGARAQVWNHGAGTLQSLGRCLDVTHSGTANGTAVRLYDCNGSAAQAWTPRGTRLVNAGSGKCLDGADADGAGLRIWDCDGRASQQWTVH